MNRGLSIVPDPESGDPARATILNDRSAVGASEYPTDVVVRGVAQTSAATAWMNAQPR